MCICYSKNVNKHENLLKHGYNVYLNNNNTVQL